MLSGFELYRRWVPLKHQDLLSSFYKKKPEDLVKAGADQMGSWLKPLEVSVFM